MLNIAQFRQFIIKDTLSGFNYRGTDFYTPEVEELLVITCANESNGGTFVVQNDGPALGIYQMEPATHDDIWKNWMATRREVGTWIFKTCNFAILPKAQDMITNWRYATIMARIQYLRSPDAIPADLDGQIALYKKVYNTPDGAANSNGVLAAYKKFARIK